MANPYGAQMITISYEALKRHPFGELQKICEFGGLKREPSILESVVQRSSFDVMRDKEMQFGWDNPDWPKGKSFVRGGEVGLRLPQIATRGVIP